MGNSSPYTLTNSKQIANHRMTNSKTTFNKSTISTSPWINIRTNEKSPVEIEAHVSSSFHWAFEYLVFLSQNIDLQTRAFGCQILSV